MARTLKKGLDYFPLDVDFFEDEKIEFISAIFGPLGEIVTIRLLTRIYRNGYFLPWGEDENLIFCKRIGGEIKPDFVDRVILELAKRSFFSEEIFKKYHVLTSKGIQERFAEAISRRKNVQMISEYICINADIIPDNVDINPLDSSNGTQRKGKERKGKEKKEPFRRNSDEFRLSDLLLQLILARRNNFKKPDLQKWSVHIDRLIRIDNAKPDEIEKVITWCQADNFWQNNILSTEKLRSQFDQLAMKMAKGGNSGKPQRENFAEKVYTGTPIEEISWMQDEETDEDDEDLPFTR